MFLVWCFDSVDTAQMLPMVDERGADSVMKVQYLAVPSQAEVSARQRSKYRSYCLSTL